MKKLPINLSLSVTRVKNFNHCDIVYGALGILEIFNPSQKL
jgi:hypothetical protein